MRHAPHQSKANLLTPHHPSHALQPSEPSLTLTPSLTPHRPNQGSWCLRPGATAPEQLQQCFFLGQLMGCALLQTQMVRCGGDRGEMEGR